jgi:hypothetical protein
MDLVTRRFLTVFGLSLTFFFAFLGIWELLVVFVSKD